MSSLRKLNKCDWLAIIFLLLYVAVFSTLTIRQHNNFSTNALDLAKFDQSIWNTSQGRPYQITIGENLVIESHFSPSLALYAPLYWIWPDVRILFITQSILLGGAGFFIYWHFRRQAPWLGLAVFAAYLMHPLLHQVNLVEFRRLTLAVFAISFAIYHLLRRQYGWMALGLALALLSKEDMSLLVAAIGLYILLAQRELKVGAATLAIGTAWFLYVPFYVLPSLMTHDLTAGYQHAASSYAYLGTSLPEIASTLLSRPGVIWQFMGKSERLLAVLNFLWPTAFMFLLAPEIVLLLVPNIVALLASTSDTMGRLGGWYPGVLVVILYWATAVGIARLSGDRKRFALTLLLVASAAAWIANSQLWPGRRFDPDEYRISEHDRQVARALESVPADAIVMAQDPLVPHLSHRREIYLLPWVRGGNRPDYVAMDRDLRTYPVGPDEYRTLFYDYLAATEYEIAEQIDSFYLFRHAGEVLPQQDSDIVFGDALRLNGISTAVAVADRPFGADPGGLAGGRLLRVELFWEVLQEMDVNYTVFVHAQAPDGRLLGQHDSWPADAHRPTSVLREGEKLRDVHYLSLSEPVALSDLTLRIGLYEGTTGKPLTDSQGREYHHLPAE